MAVKLPDEYRVQIHPDGTWFVRHLRGEHLITVGDGKEDTVELAEQAARGFIYVLKEARLARERYANEVYEFVVPA
jgi:hypothetical protein